MKIPFLLLVMLAAGSAVATEAQLAPPAQRISDAVIQTDHDAYLRIQQRIKALNDGGRRVADYHLSKAQCWLDVSFHEYTRNDRGPFPQAALAESEKLILAMEQGVTPMSDETPLVGEAVRLREDLWARARALRDTAGFQCAAQSTACAEVELVHAGNEHAQQQWRHAKPYVQIAEDLLARAAREAGACETASVSASAVALVPRSVAESPAAEQPATPAAAVQSRELMLVVELVFAFDKSTLPDLRPGSRLQLDALLERLHREQWVLDGIELVGHADRLNRTGNNAYNERLAERRVQTIREELLRRGIDAMKISTRAAGDREQVVTCEGIRDPAELRNCLLPNRRVELVLRARMR
ncbi:MAG: OmpA family protein [Sinobacteraceae bacterium]|nr:OmpA family protein [Nevskiaceae bacterium]